MAYLPEAAARLDAFLDECAKATWTEALWNLAVEYFADEGIKQFSYHHLPPLGAPDAGRVRVVSHGFPENWTDAYIRRKSYRTDPVMAQAMAQETPFKWSELGEIRDLTKAEADYVDRAQAAGIGDGLAIQAFGPGGRNGYFAIGDVPGQDSWDPSLVTILRSACQLSHLRYCRLLRDTMSAPPVLSEREQELLYWVAQGKSNGVIADIMGVSPHTVDAYMRRVFLKLGTTDRISAAVRGLSTGVIRDF